MAALQTSAAAPTRPNPPAPRSTKPPNIILITLDTTRADRMGFLGSNRDLTPNLDALARQSVVFTRAYAQVPLTTPSHAALLTGTYPQYSRLEDLGSPLRKDLPYVPDLLHERGYHTGAFIGAEILDPGSTAPGFERGFDVYDADFHQRKPGEDRYQSIERRAEDVANRAMAWLSQNRQPPFFIWLHFYDAHDPYDPPEPFKSHYASAPYDGEIAYTDSVVGSVLDILQRHGLYQDCVIAVAADHGEAFGEHGEERHGMFLYDETIHVPLLLKLPKQRFGGERVDGRVALADVAPSLLQAAGFPVPAAMQAHSLFPLIEAARAPASARVKGSEQPVYSETNYGHRTFGWAELRSWRTGKYLYVQSPKRELYDQSAGVRAAENLAVPSRAVADTLDSQLDDFLKKTSSEQTAPPKLDPAQAEKLRALGYLAADSAAANDPQASAVDPKEKIEVANRFHRALVNLEEDHYDEGIADLREVIGREPGVASAYLELGRALVHQKRYDEAIATLRVAVEKKPDSSIPHFELGKALIYVKQWDGALVEMQAAAVLKPESPPLHYFLAVIQAQLKHATESSVEFEKALQLDPGYFAANLTYGRFLLREGRFDDALARLSEAVKIDPKSGEAHWYLADAYQQLGREDDANRERESAGSFQPPSPEK
jgi:arylsulfatase A-like enzyme/Flp pilus assembly protein TadD